MDLYFSDHFKVRKADLEKYGAFNISLISDLPLFIDPFLLFNSKNEEYRRLHAEIIEYLIFLKDKSASGSIDDGALRAWYVFKEVRQNWFGFSVVGNKGSGLDMDFARALNESLYKVFSEFGKERVTKGSHLEKLYLIKAGVGKDNISDFVTNLIKEYLLEYTQTFTQKYINPALRQKFRVPRVRFNYKTESWEERTFDLPNFNGDFVILTPKDLLTRDDIWINKRDLLENFEQIPMAVPDEQLRFQINNYFESRLVRSPNRRKEPTKREKMFAAYLTIQQFPQLIDYYIKFKEQNGEEATSISGEKVTFSENLYFNNVQHFITGLKNTKFYVPAKNSYEEAKRKIEILKEYIENNDGYKLFYYKGERVKGEKDLQLLFGLVCHESTTFDVNREVNNGRGPVDAKVSKGSADKTLVEFKLASNKRLEQNLENQVEIYKKANKTKSSLTVIMYFTQEEYERVIDILKRLGLTEDESIILIDGRSDNKPSASKA